MDQTTITEAIRRAIREPKQARVTDAQIEAVTLRAVSMLGLRIKEKDPTYYNERKSVQSSTNVFSYPTGCKKVDKVWDYGGDAIAITGAADNGSGLVQITAADHGFSDEAIVTVHDVGGTTEANSTWQITYVDDDTFDLVGSTYSSAYTSGGYVFEEKASMTEIRKRPLADQSGSSSVRWYPRKWKVVVDDVGFTNDIVLDYQGAATAITDIPTEYHEALVSWPVMQLMVLDPEEKDYTDKQKTYQFHEAMLQVVLNDIERTFKASSEPSEIRNLWGD